MVVRATRYFSPVDHDKTIENAKEVLGNYWRHKRLAQRTEIALRSPAMDGMPKSPSYGNKAEDKLVAHADEVYYTSCCESAIEAINSEAYRIILTNSYLRKRYTDQQIMDKLFLSKAQYYRTKREALIAFAEICPLVEIEMRPL